MRERLTFLRDLRYARRGLCKQPSFSVIALLTLALGIGVNTAVFSVFYAVLMRPLPYSDPDRVVVIWAHFKTRGTAQVSVSGELFREIEQRQRSMSAVSGIWVTPPRTFSGDPPVKSPRASRRTGLVHCSSGSRPATRSVSAWRYCCSRRRRCSAAGVPRGAPPRRTPRS